MKLSTEVIAGIPLQGAKDGGQGEEDRHDSQDRRTFVSLNPSGRE
jgi:hypothetical protein